MITVRIDGGFGNQMFQYAFFLHLKKTITDNKISVDLNCYNPHGSGDIFTRFKLAPEQAAPSEIKRFHRNSIYHLLRPLDSAGITTNPYYREEDIDDLNSILNKKRVYLRGYWQDKRYPFSVKDQIIDCFDLGKMDMTGASADNNVILEQIASEESRSVGVHLRGGDYIGDPVYSGICTPEYYEAAFKHVSEKIKDPVFHIFTNDISMIEKCGLAGKYDLKITDINDEAHGWADLKLMSACRHHIISNSSFSWWAAFLGEATTEASADVINVIPEYMRQGVSAETLRCPCWTTVTSDGRVYPS